MVGWGGKTNPIIIDQVNDQVLRQLESTRGCKMDISPIYNAAKLKKGDGKMDAVLDILFIFTTCYNKHVEGDEKYRLWSNTILGIGITLVGISITLIVSHMFGVGV